MEEKILNDEQPVLEEEITEAIDEKKDNRENIENIGMESDDSFKEELPETEPLAGSPQENSFTPTEAPEKNMEKYGCENSVSDFSLDEIIKQSDNNFNSISSKLEEISSQILDLNTLFEKRIAYTEFEETSRKKMHDELLQYRDDMYRRIITPIIKDIIKLRNDMFKTVKFYKAKPTEEQFLPIDDFSDYIENGLDDILDNYEVEVFNSKEGDDFSHELHHPISAVNTTDEKMNGKVAESISAGYKYQGRIFERESIKRFVYKEPF